jgi:hypothetical protein
MKIKEFKRNRTVLAYHGCDKRVADKVLLEGEHLLPSEADYDWLGRVSISGNLDLIEQENGRSKNNVKVR